MLLKMLKSGADSLDRRILRGTSDLAELPFELNVVSAPRAPVARQVQILLGERHSVRLEE